MSETANQHCVVVTERNSICHSSGLKICSMFGITNTTLPIPHSTKLKIFRMINDGIDLINNFLSWATSFESFSITLRPHEELIKEFLFPLQKYKYALTKPASV